MTTGLLLITDGREGFLDQAREQVERFLPDFDQTVLVDDSDHSLGFAGAIAKGWEQIATDWIFHLEDDFRFKAPVPVKQMINLMNRRSYLIQVALKRGPVNPAEKRAGGIVEMWPNEYEELCDDRAVWTEHTLHFTTNPSVYHRQIVNLGWPQVPRSEERFTELLRRTFEGKGRFAYWGRKFDPPLVEHVGERIGTGY